jgi:hypothetical protein
MSYSIISIRDEIKGLKQQTTNIDKLVSKNQATFWV